MEIQGQIYKILSEIQVTGTFRKRELVIKTDEQYPQLILVQFTNDKCNLLDNYFINDSVKVSINIQGREWVSPQGETKYFNTITGWRIYKAGQEQSQNQYPSNSAVNQYEQKQTQAFAPPQTPPQTEETDDLPF